MRRLSFLLTAAITGGCCLILSGCSSSDTADKAATLDIPSGADDSPKDVPDDMRLPPGTPPQDPNFPRLRIITSLGELVVELDAEKAPITAKNFIWYANNQHFDGTIFHQVVADYMVLGGGYTEALEEKPTQFWIRNEAYNGLKNARGTIAMARRPDDADSSTCQFFFNLVDNPHLDHKSRESAAEFGYCVFGRVVEGMEVLDKIGNAPATDKDAFVSIPDPAVVIKSIVPVY